MDNLFKSYTDEIKGFCDNLDTKNLTLVINALKDAYDNEKHIFVAGNGGSAATVNHFYSDFGKNAVKKSEKKVKIISLATNVEAITAIGNDINVESVFSEQLKNLIEEGDVVFLVSASGNSPNIIKTAELAKSKRGKVIAFTGFSGGKLMELADICVNVPSDSYEQIEDIHLMLTHIIVCYFKSLDL